MVWDLFFNFFYSVFRCSTSYCIRVNMIRCITDCIFVVKPWIKLILVCVSVCVCLWYCIPLLLLLWNLIMSVICRYFPLFLCRMHSLWWVNQTICAFERSLCVVQMRRILISEINYLVRLTSRITLKNI